MQIRTHFESTSVHSLLLAALPSSAVIIAAITSQGGRGLQSPAPFPLGIPLPLALATVS